MGVSFIAIENFFIQKYKGKPSFKESLLEEANTKQINKEGSQAITFKNLDEVSTVQKISNDALFEDHSDFRYFFLLILFNECLF